MGSAIGDYIHLTARGYQVFGTNRNTKDKNFNIASYMKEARSKMETSINFFSNAINEEKLEELSKIMNEFRNDNYQDTNTQNRYNNLLSRAKQDIIKKRFDNYNYVFNNNLEIVDQNGNVLEQKGIGTQAAKRLYGKKGGLYLERDKIEELVKKLNVNEQYFIDAIQNLDTNKIDEAKKLSEQLEKDWEKLKSQSAKYITDNGIQLPDNLTKGKTTKNKTGIVMGKGLSSFRDTLNSLISLVAKVPPKYLAEGELFEDELAIIGKMIGGTAINQLNFVLGDKSVKMNQYNEGAFTKNITIDGQNIGEIKYDGRSKVDVAFSWGKDIIKISAKNIKITDDNKMKKWITVVSGTPFLTMLQNIDGILVNHYINIHSYHTEGNFSNMKAITGKQKKGIEGKYYGDRKTGPFTMAADINDIIKMECFIQGLTGKGYGKSSNDIANVFAVNDKKTGQIKLYSMYNILKQMSERIDKISSRGSEYNIINNIRLKNDYASSPEVRINNVLQQLHKEKISIGFYYNIINN